MKKTHLIFALTAIALAAAPLRPPPVSADDAAPPSTAPAIDAGGITSDTLQTMLSNLGYDVTVLTNDHNTHSYKIKETRDDGWSFNMSLDCSMDGQTIWFSEDLISLPDPSRTPAAPLETLLEQSWATGPAYFTKSDNELFLLMPVHNNAITPTKLKASIKFFGDTIENNYQYWNVDKWPGIVPAQAPASNNNRGSVIHPTNVAPRSPVDYNSQSTALPAPASQPQ